MVDLETMGRPPRGAIASIGAVEFDLVTGRVGSKLHRVVDLVSSAALGMELHPATIEWWLAIESRKAKVAIIGPRRLGIRDALDEFSEWFPEGARIWGNGVGFDVVILRSAYELAGAKPPWHYRAERDVRTLVGLARDLSGGEEDPSARFGGASDHHHALRDAEAQVAYCCELYREIVGAPTKRSDLVSFKPAEALELFPCDGTRCGSLDSGHTRDCARGILEWFLRKLAKPREERRDYRGGRLAPRG